MYAPAIVLISPQMGENIGAAARAMGNFGLSDLRIVNPRDGWPNKAAEAMAAHALPLIQNASVFNSLAEATADCHYVYATTARMRELNKPVVTARPFPITTGGRTAILFGRESSGLSNEEIAQAHAILTIPVNPECPSINLAQTVLLVAYEWFQHIHVPHISFPELSDIATQQEIKGFFTQLEEALDTANFWKVAHKKEKMWQNLRTLFQRATPSSQEIQSLRGMITALTSKKIK